MVKRDFSAWDFVKQEPKKGLRILDGNAGTLITDYPNVIIGGGDWVVNTTGTNNIILGSNNMTISADVSDTVYVQNLSVAGTTDIPPSEGQMRTQILEDGYWETQVYSNRFQEWVTISRTESMITAGETFVPRTRISRWVKFKSWVGGLLS